MLGALALAVLVIRQPTSTTTATATPATATATSTPVVSLASVAQQYTGYMDTFGQALQQWNVAEAKFKQTALQTDLVPTTAQVSALETPLITAGNRLIVELQQMSVPPSIHSDFTTLVGDLSAFVGDEKEVIAEWPNAQVAGTQGTADVSKLNAAAAVLATDLHVTLTTTPQQTVPVATTTTVACPSGSVASTATLGPGVDGDTHQYTVSGTLMNGRNDPIQDVSVDFSVTFADGSTDFSGHAILSGVFPAGAKYNWAASEDFPSGSTATGPPPTSVAVTHVAFGDAGC